MTCFWNRDMNEKKNFEELKKRNEKLQEELKDAKEQNQKFILEKNNNPVKSNLSRTIALMRGKIKELQKENTFLKIKLEDFRRGGQISKVKKKKDAHANTLSILKKRSEEKEIIRKKMKEVKVNAEKEFVENSGVFVAFDDPECTFCANLFKYLRNETILKKYPIFLKEDEKSEFNYLLYFVNLTTRRVDVYSPDKALRLIKKCKKKTIIVGIHDATNFNYETGNPKGVMIKKQSVLKSTDLILYFKVPDKVYMRNDAGNKRNLKKILEGLPKFREK